MSMETFISFSYHRNSFVKLREKIWMFVTRMDRTVMDKSRSKTQGCFGSKMAPPAEHYSSQHCSQHANQNHNHDTRTPAALDDGWEIMHKPAQIGDSYNWWAGIAFKSTRVVSDLIVSVYYNVCFVCSSHPSRFDSMTGD